MGFDRVAAVFAATLSHFSTSSATGSSVSSSALPPLGSPFRSTWAGHGRTGSLRLSSSLQDFSTYRKVSAEETDLAQGINAGVLRTKAFLQLQREGNGASSFSKEKALPLTSLRSRRWVKAAVGFSLFLLLFTLIFLGFGWLRPNWSIEASHFSIVLDCGSTGTRVHVYEWVQNDGKDHEKLPMLLHPFPQFTHTKAGQQNGRAYHRMETEPGFDKLLHNESGLRAAIEPLLLWAEKQIPVNAHKNTPLFLLATAGLRRMTPSDSEWILDKAWSILEESSFMCRRSWVKIITGVEEAYYGWVALNYNMNRLGNSPMQETFGALDLGGSSLQVTFESREPTQGEHGLNLSIGKTEHHINAYSLAGYGLNDAFEKSVVLLLRKISNNGSRKLSDGRLQLDHPCLHVGYRQKYSCSQCSLHQDGSPSVSGKDMSSKATQAVIELIGSPNWEECEALAKSTVNASEWLQSVRGIDCKQYPCALAIHQPQPRGQFYAMSGFFVVYKFFNLSSDARLDDIVKKGRMFCMKTWHDAERSVVPQPFIEQYCFRAPYVVSLLRDGLHLKDQQVVVGSGSITWTLGAALLEAGPLLSRNMRMTSQARLDIFRKGHFYLDPTTHKAVLFVFLIIMIFALSCIRKWILRLWRKPYLPLFGQHTSSGSPIPKLPSPFRFQSRSPGNGVSAGRSVDGRLKIPVSPSTSSFQQQFGLGQSLAGGSGQHVDPNMHQSPTSIGMSFSSNNVGQIQNDTATTWTPHRGQTRLQSRRSQSREDLNSSILDSHVVKL
uniref:Apyrase n=1 Tax=Araucaria cunninghamii TaxID=56994 RepID=A0A0D6QWU4_ARACU